MNNLIAGEPFRILWICSHRTHRYEELSLFLRAGAEIVPIITSNDEYPNAVELTEESDPLNPGWRELNTIPTEILHRLRSINYYERAVAEEDQRLINKWIDLVIIASYTKILVSFLSWFDGFLMLRAFGGYPYSAILRPHTREGKRNLERIAQTDRYFWSPNIPYLSATEDPRITRNAVIIPAAVSSERYPCEWFGLDSDTYIAEVISLIARDRLDTYNSFLNSYKELPLRIFGQNTKGGPDGSDPRIVGTLTDEEYYQQLARCRAMLYEGLSSPYHIHYHALEALAMKIPVIFFSNASIAHFARYYGATEEYLRDAGMCDSPDKALQRAKDCLRDPGAAVELSQKQGDLRDCFSPSKAQAAVKDLIYSLKLKRNYFRNHHHRFAGHPSFLARSRRYIRRLLASPGR